MTPEQEFHYSICPNKQEHFYDLGLKLEDAPPKKHNDWDFLFEPKVARGQHTLLQNYSEK